MGRFLSVFMLAGVVGALGACEGDPVRPGIEPPPDTTPTLPRTPILLDVLGHGPVPERYSAEVAVAGPWAYTTTWTFRGTVPGNAIKIWNVAGAPVLVDSVIVPNATTLGDVQISDDGRLLVVATERTPGTIVIYDRSDPPRLVQLARFGSASTTNGVHTVKLGRQDGRLYAFLSVNPSPPRLVVVDITDPAAPVEVLARPMGSPFLHDVFVRDGLLFTALWDEGTSIWDIGGGGRGGSPADPVLMANVRTQGGAVHNLWWFHDPTTGSKRWLFVGEEVPMIFGSRSAGDIHVVDLQDMTSPREVAYFNVPDAGTHNFSMDEASGILYAAYYNGGVRALDVRGNLAACPDSARALDGRCDLGRSGREAARGLTAGPPVFVWGVAYQGNHLFATDMLSGLYKLDVTPLRR
jgi:WD40 repeat protein